MAVLSTWGHVVATLSGSAAAATSVGAATARFPLISCIIHACARQNFVPHEAALT
jgi:hypothetical protein